MEESTYSNNRTPAQCRNGPIQHRSCTDCLCCLIYVLLIAAAVFLAVFYSGATNLHGDEIREQLKNSTIGNPLLAVSHAWTEILLTLAFVVAFCMVLVVTTFVIPAIVTYIYIPLFLLLMLASGITLLIRYFGRVIPGVDPQVQKQWVQSKNIITLIMGVLFLLGFQVSICLICTKRGKLQNIHPILKIAKQFYLKNCYVFLVSILLSILTICMFFFNFMLLTFSQAQQQFQVPQWVPIAVIIMEIVWTHGFLQALSDFFFESVAIHWYFKQRRMENQQEQCCSQLCLTMKLILRHIGTISFGFILAYIPQTLYTLLGKYQAFFGCCESNCCRSQCCNFRNLSKYCYIQTILQSLSFCPANREMFRLRKRTKATLPELYMMGSFYISLAKILIVTFAVVLSYLLIAQQKSQVFANPVNIMGPLLFVLMAALQISNHWMNSTGLVSDTLVFMYTVDLEIEKRNYGQIYAYSCPQEIQQTIESAKIYSAVNE